MPTANHKPLKTARAFHTRFSVTPKQDAALRAAAAAYGSGLGMAIAGLLRGEAVGAAGGIRTQITKRFNLDYRYSDSACRRADGLIKSATAGIERAIVDLTERANAAKRTADNLARQLEGARTPKALARRRRASGCVTAYTMHDVAPPDAMIEL